MSTRAQIAAAFLRQGAPAPIPTTMLILAARELCRQHAEVCEVNKDDAWNAYSEDFRKDARLVLEAIGAGELVELLRELIDMEGPQPGTAAWADKVRTQLARLTP